MDNKTPLAIYELHGHHRVVLRKDKTVTCDTCSLSATAANAVLFMYANGVLKMTFDGADLKRA